MSVPVGLDGELHTALYLLAEEAGYMFPRSPLGIYAHEFNQEAQLEQARTRLDAEHGTVLEHAVGDGRQPGAHVEAENVLAMRR